MDGPACGSERPLERRVYPLGAPRRGEVLGPAHVQLEGPDERVVRSERLRVDDAIVAEERRCCRMGFSRVCDAPMT